MVRGLWGKDLPAPGARADSPPLLCPLLRSLATPHMAAQSAVAVAGCAARKQREGGQVNFKSRGSCRQRHGLTMRSGQVNWLRGSAAVRGKLDRRPACLVAVRSRAIRGRCACAPVRACMGAAGAAQG